MSRIARWVKAGACCAGLVFAASNMLCHEAFAAQPATQASCAAPACRQFDFWAGDWDAFDAGSPAKAAHVRVDPILDGCVLREDYQALDGHEGQSFTIYDAARKVWHQSWVTNRGQMLEIEGKLNDAGEMVLSGEDRAKGKLVRGTWKPVDGGVREIGVTSADGGKTWKPWFDLMFRPASKQKEMDSPGTSSADEKSAIAALDAQYQDAVKRNDADAMDRILADDFVLVIGSGKTYSKADLLAEARSGRYQYERQDDPDRTVRIWGDTAVVTAKLLGKGTDQGKPFEYQLWFSDTYTRTAAGWRYVFGQASLPLPQNRPIINK